MDERFLISKKKTGLGSDMATMLGAWYYAHRTSRTLVVDWRSSLYLADRKANAFPYLFRKPEEIDGVKLICDDSLRRLKFPKPVVFLHRMEGCEYDALLTAGTDLPAPTLLCRRPMHIFPELEAQKRFYSRLQLHDDVQQEIDEFRHKEFADATVLGVHFRHGNGEYLGFRPDAGLHESCIQIAAACRQMYKVMKPTLRGRFRIFLATDSQEAEQQLKLLLSSLFTRPKAFHEAGGGRLHRRDLGLENARNALVEMYLLAHCNSLIYNNSWFSYYARLTGQFDIPPVNLHPDTRYATL
ncbi:MAG: nodulation protein NodZ [Terracidiphilus sp.]|jgi:hypothetical protein